MPQSHDLSRSPAALDQDSTLIAVIEMSQASWLVGAIVPDVERRPLKKLAPDAEALRQLLQPHRTSPWAKGSRREEAIRAGRTVTRIAVAYEAGRDGCWLARWLRARYIETHVIHASSVAVARGHRRAKTDRLDVNLLQRAFLGWLRGEGDHCTMAAIPTLEAEDTKRPSREHEALVGERTRIVNRMRSALARLGIRDFKPHLRKAPERLAALRTPEGSALPPNTLAELPHGTSPWAEGPRDMMRLQLVKEQIADIERTRLERLRQRPADAAQAMLGVLTRFVGVGIETADVLVHELLIRNPGLRRGRLVGQRAGDHHAFFPARSLISQGSLLPRLLARTDIAPHRVEPAGRPLTKSRRRWPLPRLALGPSLILPPVPSWRGTRACPWLEQGPSEAAKCRPLLKAFGSTTIAAIALARACPRDGGGSVRSRGW